MTVRDALTRLRVLVESFDDEPPAGEPLYDPVHIGGVLVSVMAAAGALYWLLWTAFVFEGGIAVKAGAVLRLAGGASLASLGYEGPWDRGAFEGWAGNIAAVLLCAVVLWCLRAEWRRAERAARDRG
ncbi:MAG: hypothetical protein HYZ75_00555 [Elusimicrobia bacterium]|nr:hypothetical protein [Elusimicrobiota bacterium]